MGWRCHWCVFLLVVSACTGRPTGGDDAGSANLDASSTGDASSMGVTDAGVRDAATAVDSGTLPDAAVDLDAASLVDAAGPVDASLATDAAVDSDASLPADASVTDDAALPADAGAAGDAALPDDAGTVSDAAVDLDAALPDDAASVPDAAIPVDAGPATAQTVRIMASNMSSLNYQSYGLTGPHGAGMRILQGLHPDIVLMQEFNICPTATGQCTGSNTDTDVRMFVDAVCGAGCVYARELPGPGIIPNGVISRYPILESGFWEDSAPNREFFYARLDVPGPVDLWIVSVHLLTTDTARPGEASSLAQYVAAHVPPGDFLVVGGDLNTNVADPVVEPAMATFATFLAVTPLPDDGTGNTGTNANRLLNATPDAGFPKAKPYDRIMPTPNLDAHSIPVLVGTNIFPNGLVFDSHIYTPLSDVAPVAYGDSYAPSMQHMGVVRDFSLPVP